MVFVFRYYVVSIRIVIIVIDIVIAYSDFCKLVVFC